MEHGPSESKAQASQRSYSPSTGLQHIRGLQRMRCFTDQSLHPLLAFLVPCGAGRFEGGLLAQDCSESFMTEQGFEPCNSTTHTPGLTWKVNTFLLL